MSEFTLAETTIAEIQEALRAGRLTARELTARYRERIAAYDRGGPELNGVVTVNDAAEERAARLDEALAESGPVGPLHGVPVLVKDQALTAGLATTFGSAAFADYVPDTDATVVSELRGAGAVVLAKTNLPDWAAGFVGRSSVLGQTKNPYDTERDPGGSSAGTAAGVAANLGAVGIGEDTGGSIRVPASCCNLFGIRVTTGLISRTGLSPLVARQDTAGPMARTVADLARVLDVLVGYDPTDPWTGAVELAGGAPYRDAVDPAGLEGARIGTLRQAFADPADPAGAPVAAAVEDALDAMAAAGAELVEVEIPDLDGKLERTALYAYQSRRDIDAFLASLPDPPAGSVRELYEAGAYDPRLALFETVAEAPADPTDDPDYWRAVAAQGELRREILALHAEHDLDALAFPDVGVVPRRYADLGDPAAAREAFPVNTVVASQSSCPAVSVPTGFGDLPVGLELLGPPHSERRLLALAAGYESEVDPRRPPATAPPL